MHKDTQTTKVRSDCCKAALKNTPPKKTKHLEEEATAAANEISVHDAIAAVLIRIRQNFYTKRKAWHTTLKAFLGGQHCFALLWTNIG